MKKQSYFQGGGGENEPTPKKKKYKSEPALVNQTRFVEPFYKNYDVYETEGVNGPPKHGPGAGWHDMGKYKSIKEFLAAKRKKLQDKYKADDSWIQDDGSLTKKDPKKSVRAAILYNLVKLAEACNDSDIEYTDRTDAYICKNCLHMGPNCGEPKPTSKELHAEKNHNPDHIDWSNDGDKQDPKYLKWKKSLNKDNNSIDFPIDDQISDPIIGNSGSYSDSVPIGGASDEYLPLDDFEGKSPDKLDFGRDYVEDEKMAGCANCGFLGRDNEEDPCPDCGDSSDSNKQFGNVNIDKFMEKYLNPAEPPIYGLPDGILPIKDLDSPSNEQLQYGTTDSGNTFYDKM